TGWLAPWQSSTADWTGYMASNVAQATSSPAITVPAVSVGYSSKTPSGIEQIHEVNRIIEGIDAGSVGTAGSTALLADQVRSTFGVSGSGVKVGVLSDSFNLLGGASADEQNGNLPASGVTVLQEGSSGTDEGRAMLELIHQIAPGAQLYFATAGNSDAQMAADIASLRNAGCNIIVDDVLFLDDPIFQKGLISQAVDQVVNTGGLYFTAAGNNSSNGYQSAWRGAADDTLFNFNASGGTTTTQEVNVTVTPSYGITFELQWDQPFYAPSTQFNIIATDQYGHVFSSQAQGGVDYGDQAVTLLQVNDPFSTTTNLALSVSIQKLSGPDPTIIKYGALGDGLPVAIVDTTSGDATTGTVFGHAEDPNAITVGAADANSSQLESYSSSGSGTELLFDASGARLSSPIAISKVDLVGVDGISTDVIDPFFGTSAAAPTVAAVAALLEQLDPGANNNAIEGALEDTATNLFQPSALQGAGLVNALAAADSLVQPIASGIVSIRSIATAQQVAVSSLFTVTDPAGHPISQYEVYLADASTGGQPE